MESLADKYYRNHAEEDFHETVGLDVSHLYPPFLTHIPKGGKILDAGCGSERDTLHFLQQGYEVTAFDASSQLAANAKRLAGIQVDILRFQEMQYEATSDGVWACASLLHVFNNELPAPATNFWTLVKPLT